MQISDISRHLGVSPRVIRHYEVAGLLRPGRSENGYRRFSKADIRRAEWVRDLIGAGFSTREIRKLTACIEDGLDDDDGNACTAALQNKLAQIDRASALLKKRRQLVAERLVVLKTRTEPVPITKPRPLSPARR